MARLAKNGNAIRRPSTLLRVGDTVMVLSGGNKRKNPIKAQVGKILTFRGVDRVVVEGLNFRTYNVKPSGAGGRAQQVKREGAIHVSNVMYFVEGLKRPVRLRSGVRSDGTKVRGFLEPVSRNFIEVSEK